MVKRKKKEWCGCKGASCRGCWWQNIL